MLAGLTTRQSHVSVGGFLTIVGHAATGNYSLKHENRDMISARVPTLAAGVIQLIDFANLIKRTRRCPCGPVWGKMRPRAL